MKKKTQKIKKVVKKKVIVVLISFFIPFMAVAAVGSGIISVVQFVESIIESIANFFAPSNATGDKLNYIDLSAFSCEELLFRIDDPLFFTDEALQKMMIDRESLKRLFQGVQDFNTKYKTVTKKVGTIHKWTTVEEKEIQQKDGTITTEKTTTCHEEKDMDYKEIKLSEEDYKGAYKLDWQPLYCLALFEQLQQHTKSKTIMTITDKNEDSKDGDTKEEDSEVKEEQTDLVIGSNPNYDYYITTHGTYNPDLSTIGNGKYNEYFEKAADKTGIPVGLLKAVSFRESSFIANQVSNQGCIGLMQINPRYSTYTVEELYNPEINIMAGAKHLKSNIKSQPNLVLALSEYFWGCANMKKGHYDFKYAARILSTYMETTITEEDLKDASFCKQFQIQVNGIGCMNEKTGELYLSENAIKDLIEDFAPKVIYEYDYINEEKDTYNYDECASMVCDEQSEGDPNTEAGAYYWYEPKVIVNQVRLPYADINFSDGIPEEYILRMDRWEEKAHYYWKFYDAKWLQKLIEILPLGKNAISNYLYIADQCTTIIEATAEYTNAEGKVIPYYEASDPYKDVPLNADGMTRKWSMTENDFKLIYMSDSEMWKMLTGVNTRKRPNRSMTSESYMDDRMTTIEVPIWEWKYPGTKKLDVKSSTMRLTVNQAIADMMLHIFTDIYNDSSHIVIDKNYVSCYKYRDISDSQIAAGTLSSHSFGAAIDLNYNTSLNGYDHYAHRDYCHTPTKDEWDQLPECQAKYELFYVDCPLVCIMKAYGWVWGGTQWNTKWDAMHFSKIGDKDQSLGVRNNEKYYK